MEIYQNHPLAPYTTVKIGGPADTFIVTHTTEEFINALKKYQNITILGNGSNVLISDSGIRGTVIKNLSNKIEYLPNNQVKVDSGIQLPFLITDTINHSLSGLEEFAYIPSTIGAAIYGNIHGVNKNTFDKFVLSTEKFNSTIISAILQLVPGNSVTSKQIVADIIAKKTIIQSMNSLGSVFKNPKNDSAGRIIDQELHLKAFQIGDAQVSPLHGNFILNLGHATAKDYYTVIKKIQSEAKSKLNITLEPEIKFLGDF